jgi:hypothetical protein
MKLSNIDLGQLATKGIRIASEVADIAIHYASNPGPLGKVAVAARTLDAFQKTRTTEEPFRNWKPLNVGGLASFLCAFLSREGMINKLKREGEGQAFQGDVFDVPFGFIQYEHWTVGPKIPEHVEADVAKAALGRALWEAFGNSVRVRTNMFGDDFLERDELVDHFPSKTAERIFERAQRFHEAGFTRSYLLFGKPGAGKSHIMRAVAHLAGGFSLRIEAAELAGTRTATAAIDILKPSAVVIDDIDRLESPSKILGPLERLADVTKLVLASANHEEKLDFAGLRPGRFDQLWHIDALDEEIHARLVGDVEKEISDRLRALPVAYIHEFHKRTKALGRDQALREIDDLEAQARLVAKLGGMEDKAKNQPVKG